MRMETIAAQLIASIYWGPLYAMAKGRDHEFMGAPEIHPKAVENWHWIWCGHGPSRVV